MQKGKGAWKIGLLFVSPGYRSNPGSGQCSRQHTLQIWIIPYREGIFKINVKTKGGDCDMVIGGRLYKTRINGDYKVKSQREITPNAQSGKI